METQARVLLLGLGLDRDAPVATALSAAVEDEPWLRPLIQGEEEERCRRSRERRLGRAALGAFKPMGDFDWTHPRKIDREAIEALFDLHFLCEHTGTPGGRVAAAARVHPPPSGGLSTMIRRRPARRSYAVGARGSKAQRRRDRSPATRTKRRAQPLAEPSPRAKRERP